MAGANISHLARRPNRAQRHAVALALILAGCTRHNATTCADTIEVRALACSGGTARREGAALRIHLESGRDTLFADDTNSENPGGYRYAGRVGRAAFHLIQSYGHETYPTWVFVNPRSGKSIVASDEPVFSPDSERFVTAPHDWDNCAEYDEPHLDVWRLTDSVPVREWHVASLSCGRHSGWGLTDPHWRSRDSLDLVRHEVPAPGTLGMETVRPVRAAHDATGWHLIDPR